MPRWTKLWEDRGYPHPFLMMQITNVRYHDNGSPQPALPDFIRRWNETNPEIRLRFVTISEFFDRLRAEPEERLPLMRGDWTDWWNFGAGSTAHETSQAMQGQRDLDDALGLDAWRPTATAARRRSSTRRGGRWRSMPSIPGAPTARFHGRNRRRPARSSSSSSPSRRKAPASPACSGATGWSGWPNAAGGEEPRLLVYNPHPFPVRQSLRLPYLPPLAGAPEPSGGFGIEAIVPTGPQSHRIQRQDVLFSDLSDENAYLERADRRYRPSPI